MPLSDAIHPQKRLPDALIWGIVLVSAAPIVPVATGLDLGLPSGPTPGGLPPGPELVESVYAAMAGAFLHTLLECASIALAVFTVLLAFTVYRRSGDVVAPLMGVALVCAAAMDGMHLLASDRLMVAASDPGRFIPFTWATSRLFCALVLMLGAALLTMERMAAKRRGPRFLPAASLALGVGTILTMRALQASSWIPPVQFQHSLIARPWDVAGLVLFAFAGLVVFRRLDRRHPSAFTHALVISAIPWLAAQSLMSFAYADVYDGAFNAAHLLKVLACLVPLLGLIADCVRSYQPEEVADGIGAPGQSAPLPKARFLAAMSHDIRTSLSGVLGMAELLRSSDLDAKQTSEVDAIVSSGRELLSILNDVLDVSKIQAGRQELAVFAPRDHPGRTESPARRDVVTLADKRVLVVDQDVANRDALVEQLRAVGVQVSSAADTRGALEQLREAVSRDHPFDLVLLDRELPDPRAVEPAVSAIPLVLLTSSDHPSEEKEARKAGYEACLPRPCAPDALLEVLMDVLAAASFGTDGRTVIAGYALQEPIAEASDEQQAEGGSAQTGAPGACRILLVEDNEINRIVAVSMLERMGWSVDVASDGQEAVAMWEQFPYDLILMDCMMPIMDGLAATRAIRARETALQHIPIVALTASVMPDERAACLAAGMDDFTSKPVDFGVLSEVVARWVPATSS